MNKQEKLSRALISLVKAGGFFIIYFASQIITGFVVGLILAFTSVDIDAFVAKNTMAISVISNVVAIIGCLLLLKFIKKESDASAALDMNFNFCSMKSVLGFCLALGAFGQFAISFILSLIPFPESWIEAHGENSSVITNSSVGMQILAVAIVAPLAEEIIFRTCIQGSLAKGLPKWVAIVLTSVIFGVMHATPIAIIYATALGILMGWLYAEFKSIIPAMIFHLAFNLMSIIMDKMPILLFFVSPVIFVVCIVYLARYARENKAYQQLTEQKGDNDDEAL